MGGQLQAGTAAAETAPGPDPRFGLVAGQGGQPHRLGPVPPGTGLGQDGHGAVAGGGGGTGQALQGFGPAALGLLQQRVGVHQGGPQPPVLGIEGWQSQQLGPLTGFFAGGG